LRGRRLDLAGEPVAAGRRTRRDRVSAGRAVAGAGRFPGAAHHAHADRLADQAACGDRAAGLQPVVDCRRAGAAAGGAGTCTALTPAGNAGSRTATADPDRSAAVSPDRRRFRPAHPDPAQRPAVHRQHPCPAPGAYHRTDHRRLADLRRPVVGPLASRLARAQRGQPHPDRHGDAGAGVLRLEVRAGSDPASHDGLSAGQRQASIASLRRSTPTTSISPTLPFFGAFAFGTMARRKPWWAASFRRSSPFGTGRISPDNPTSPKVTMCSGNGRSRKLDSTASSTGRSAAVSCTRMPPTTLTNTSWSYAATPPCRCSTASSMARRFCSSPRVTRRGLPSEDWSTSACTSTSSGRVPSRVTITALPEVGPECDERKIADGFGTSRSPLSDIANTPSSLTAPKRFLNARNTRKREPDSPSKYSTASTMCSST